MIRNAKRLLLPALFVAASAVSALAGSVSISSPTSGATVSSPIRVVAKAYSSAPVTGMKIYLDSNSVYSTTSSSLDRSISAGSGSHKITVRGWDSTGASFSAVRYVTVSGSTSNPGSGSSGSVSIPSYATSFNRIEEMSGWGHCTTCAGGGENAKYSMTRGQSSPSLDGNSTKFWLGGSTSFSHGLWWKRLGASSSATHFVLDMYFRMDKPSNSQGLEFAMNQHLGSGWYKFSTQCTYQTKQWRVWDSRNRGWVGTGIPCNRPAANTWNHVTFEYARSGGKAIFVAVTLNGKKSYINKSFYPQSGGGDNSIGVHYQMNGNINQSSYTTWVDKMRAWYW